MTQIRPQLCLRLYFCFLSALPARSFLQKNEPTYVPTKPIEKVAIIGGGIAGLSLAHALANPNERGIATKPIEVSMFDSRRDFDRSAGAGVQLNGGMAVLGKINPSVQKAVMKAAVPISRLQARNKSWFRDTTDALWDMSLETIIRNAGGKAEEELFVDSKVMWYSIMRGALQETLFQLLPEQSSMSFAKTLVNIRGQDGGAVCEFADGTVAGPFDLVVGCDGIKSAVKEYICTDKISQDASCREGGAAALYSGIRVGFAVQEIAELGEDEKLGAIQQVFGDGAYLFSGPYGNGEGRPPSRSVFITALDENYNGPFKRKESKGTQAVAENSDWAQDNLKPLEETRKKMLRLYEESHVEDERIRSALSQADRIFELGVYFHNPIALAGYKKKIPRSDGKFAVLCGDSRAAMPPFLGQGANQAIQDAYLLADKVHTFNRCLSASEETLEENFLSLLQDYEKTRWFPTASITAKAAILGYLETGGRSGFYAKFRDSFFAVLAALGIPARVLLDAATPKV